MRVVHPQMSSRDPQTGTLGGIALSPDSQDTEALSLGRKECILASP